MRVIILLLSLSFFVQATSLQEQLNALKKRIQVQENALKGKGEESSFTFSGRIQFDTVLNTPSINTAGGANKYDYYLTPKSFSNNTPITKLSSSVRNSRLWFKGARKTDFGTIRSLIEVDFYGSNGTETVSNSHNIRLRHAYITLNNWTVGQTYSTLMGNSLPDTILVGGDVSFVRQPLVRYTLTTKNIKFDLAFENPETKLSGTTYNDDTFFDTILRLRLESNHLRFSASSMLRVLNTEQNNTLIETLGYALNSSIKYTFANNSYLQAAALYGKGVGRYTSFGYFDAGTLQNNTISLLSTKSAHLSYTLPLNRYLRTTVLGLYLNSANETQIAHHINLRYAPINKVLISLEYAYATLNTPHNAIANVQRVFSSFSFIF